MKLLTDHVYKYRNQKGIPYERIFFSLYSPHRTIPVVIGGVRCDQESIAINFLKDLLQNMLWYGRVICRCEETNWLVAHNHIPQHTVEGVSVCSSKFYADGMWSGVDFCHIWDRVVGCGNELRTFIVLNKMAEKLDHWDRLPKDDPKIPRKVCQSQFLFLIPFVHLLNFDMTIILPKHEFKIKVFLSTHHFRGSRKRFLPFSLVYQHMGSLGGPVPTWVLARTTTQYLM